MSGTPEAHHHRQDLKERAIDSLFKQGPAVIILTGMLFLTISLVREIIKTEVPRHLLIIQEGYQRINEDNIRYSRDRDVRYTETIKGLQDTFEKTTDKLERIYFDLKSRESSTKGAK